MLELQEQLFSAEALALEYFLEFSEQLVVRDTVVGEVKSFRTPL